MRAAIRAMREHDSTHVGNERRQEPLRSCITNTLKIYFTDLQGHEPDKLYEMVISEVEQPLLEFVMSHAGSNITRAAELLGINRATLRKKLRKYGMAK